MRRSALALLPCLLLAATGLTLVGLAQALSAPSPALHAAGSDAAANAALVRLFYAATNDALQTGNPAQLATILSPSFVAHGIGSSTATDRAGFEAYVFALHASYPALRLTVADLVAGQEAAVARVAVDGGDRGAFVGAAITGPAAPWGTTDSFQIRDARITGLWGSADVFPRPRFRVRLPGLPAESTTIVLDRLRLVEGAGGIPPVDRWPRLIWTETGTIALSVAAAHVGDGEGRPVTITRATARSADFPEAAPPGGSTILRAGDVAVIPGGVAYDLAPAGAAVVDAWGMSMHPLWPATAAESIVDPRLGDAAAFDAPPPLTGWPLGAAVTHVASWTVADGPQDAMSLEIGRLTLGPGAELAIGRATGPVALVVETGTLGGSTAHDPIGPGGSVVLPAGGTFGLAAADTAPVTCLVFALIPEQG